MVLILRSGAPDWEALEAKCFSMITGPAEPDPFFGHENDSSDDELAMAICNGVYDQKVCPARHECLLFALKNNEAWGVWGGLPLLQRHDMRRHMPREDWKFENADWTLQGPVPEIPSEDLEEP